MNDCKILSFATQKLQTWRILSKKTTNTSGVMC